MADEFVNKVAESGIISLDLEKYFPKEEILVFDIKDYLFMGLILREKEFRQALKQLDVQQYQQKIIAVTCTADAIIPMWAYMLISSTLQQPNNEILFGNESEVKNKILIRNIRKINATEFIEKRVVVKGCGENPIPEEAYLEITNLLKPVVKSIMFGEPCSTVPIYKKQQDKQQ